MQSDYISESLVG